MKSFVDEHFAVLVVLSVFFALFAAYLLEVHWGGKVPGTVDWLEGELKEVVGAILMGLTSKGAQIVNGLRKTDAPVPNSSGAKP